MKKLVCAFGVVAVSFLAVAETAANVAAVELPLGYKQLDWIEGTGGVGKQYIKTGYRPKCTDRFEIKVQFTSLNANSALWCARQNLTVRTMTGFYLVGTGHLRFDRNEGQTDDDTEILTETDYVITADYGTLETTVNGELAVTMTDGSFDPGTELYLFASHANGGSPGNYGSFRLYYFKAYDEDGNLIHDYVPACKSFLPAEDVSRYGVYDLVEQKFCKNASAKAAFSPSEEVEVTEDPHVLVHWKFDPSAPYTDCSGNGNVIDLKSRPMDFTGGYAHFAHGTTGQIGRAFDFKSYKQLTIEFFVRVNTHYNAQIPYFTHYGYNGAGTGFFTMYGGENNKAAENLTMTWLKSSAGRETESTADGVLADRKWHHVAVVMDASSDDAAVTDEMKLYLDGVLQSDSTSQYHHTAGFNGTQFVLGWTASGNGTSGWLGTFGSQARPFEGDMDDLRISTAALTPDRFLTKPSVIETVCEEAVVEWTDGAVVPAEGSDVHVPATASITLDANEPTPLFKSITIDGTMRFMSSNNCLRAEAVRVGAAGRLIGGEPFKGAEETVVSNRIWIACTDLTVEKGGLISAAGCGFLGGKTGDTVGYGPGGCYSNQQDKRAGAGTHAGFMTTWMAKPPYGSAEWPETAGSGGTKWTNDISAPDGGGVVRIDATGTVTVNGRITADSLDCIPYERYGRSCASAGGSILVNCARICGTGDLSAKGGDSSGNDHVELQSAPGGGGRIAVHYNPDVQTAAEAKDLVFSVQAGKSYPRNYSFSETGFWMYAGEGTLWFPDAKLITAETISNFRGRLVNVAEVVLDGDTVISNWVGFATDGVKIKVNGDLTVTGADGRLEIGGVSRATANVQRKSYVSSVASILEVAGDLSVEGASRLDIYAASTNDAQVAGAYVKVEGMMSIATNCYVYPVSHPSNGGSVLFTVNDFALAAGGTFGLTGGGFSGGSGGKDGWGPGKGSANIGAGHGGLGGRVVEASSKTYGQIYGDAVRPTLAGSGGGHGWAGQNGGGCGGGLLHVVAANSISIAGTVDATGTTPQGYNNGSAGGSGGSVLFDSLAFDLAESGMITARGGDSGSVAPSAGKYTAAGGGGRIAIWTGAALWKPGMRKSRYVVSETVPEAWIDRFSVAGGEAQVAERGYAGEPGTVRFVTTLPQPGVLMIVR